MALNSYDIAALSWFEEYQVVPPVQTTIEPPKCVPPLILPL
jgi:hypothetical protein